MTAPWANPIGVVYMALFFSSGAACMLAIPRARTVDHADIRRGLVGLLATTAAWALLKTAYFVVPAPLDEAAYTLGLVSGFATIWAWLYFCSAYTGRRLHRNTTLRRLAAAVFLLVVSAKLTNPLHRLYFQTTEVAVPFSHLAIEHGILHWIATGLSYVLAAIGLFMIAELFIRSGYDTRPLGVLTAMLGLPVILDLVAITTPRLLDFIYAPIGVAVFAIGVLFVFGGRFLAVRSAIQGDAPTLFLDSEGRIEDCSPNAREIFPVLEDAIGERIGDVLPTVARHIDGENDTDTVIETDVDGEQRYYLAPEQVLTFGGDSVRVVTFVDVTEIESQQRRLSQRERELAQRNEFYRAVIAASFAFVFRIDLDGTFSFVSPSVEPFLGYSADALDGQSMAVLSPSEELTEQYFGYLTEVERGESIRVRDLPLRTQSGETVHADLRAVPIYEPSVPVDERTATDIVGAQVMVRDASERRRREGLISVINRVLRHNVRNKLTVINGYAGLLEANLEGEGATQARHIVETADRLLDLTESARRIERNRNLSPTLEAVDIVPIVESAVDRLAERYPEATISLDCPDSAVARTLPRVETAVWELLENAAKHSGERPTVDIDIDVDDEWVWLRIRDDGPGLPEGEREVLATGSEEPLVHGQGLGLWLAYWLVSNLDGHIDVPSVTDGTTVEIRLPAGDGPETAEDAFGAAEDAFEAAESTALESDLSADRSESDPSANDR